MSWGTKIIIAFVCFIGVISTMVYISMNQNIGLVAENYYEEELAYEDQIQRIKNTNELESPIEFKLNRQTYVAKFIYPQGVNEVFKKGVIQFFRASNSELDREYEMSLGDNNSQEIDINGFRTGLWTIKIRWESDEKEYYKELSLVL